MKAVSMFSNRSGAMKLFALGVAASAAFLAGTAQAQTTNYVGGQGVIGDETLATVVEGPNLVASVPRGGVLWAAAGGEGVVYCRLNSPTLTVPTTGPVTLTFTHRYFFEGGYDGGAVYVTVNGVGPTYVPLSAFTANGYTANLSGSSAFTGMDVFNGQSGGWDTATLIESVASLGSLNAGDKISIQFRGGWDEGYFEPAPNWEIGTVDVRREGAGTAMLNVDFLNGPGGFTAAGDPRLAGPWLYPGPKSEFEINGDTLTADRYVPDTPGATTIIDINGTDLLVVLLAGTLDAGDSFNLFNVSGGTTMRGSYNSIKLPPGTWNLSNLGVTGTIVYVGPPVTDADASTVTASPAFVPADGSTMSTITVTLKSQAGDPVVGKTVTLAPSRGVTDTISAASGPSGTNGVVTFTVKSGTVGLADFTATDTTDTIGVTQKATVKFQVIPTWGSATDDTLNTGQTAFVETDVKTNGTFAAAVTTGVGGTLNGVTFERWTAFTDQRYITFGTSPISMAWAPDAGRNQNGWGSPDNAYGHFGYDNGTVSDLLLTGGGEGDSPGTLTLGSLVANHSYQVQIWAPTWNQTFSTTVGGVSLRIGQPPGTLSQNVIATFTADGTESQMILWSGIAPCAVSLRDVTMSITSITGPLGGNYTITGISGRDGTVTLWKTTDVATPLVSWAQIDSKEVTANTPFTFTVLQGADTKAFFRLSQ